MKRFSILLALLLISMTTATVSTVAVDEPLVVPVAPVRSFEVVAAFPHDPTAYTQGLILADGQLYEGTGLYGQSELRRVDLQTGEVLQARPLDDQYFGEGITILGDTIYQITWQSQIAFVYDLTTFEPMGTFFYATEGWGLTHDDSSLIMSDGSDQIYFRDPETFEVTRQISVRDGENPVPLINELEYIDGVIWANIYRTNYVARIDPENGNVIDWLDLTELMERATANGRPIEVLNGIAWNPDTLTAYVTGKNWPLLFEIRLIDEN